MVISTFVPYPCVEVIGKAVRRDLAALPLMHIGVNCAFVYGGK